MRISNLNLEIRYHSTKVILGEEKIPEDQLHAQAETLFYSMPIT